MNFKRKAKPEDSVNLTPLIDVVFLLLIFFMVSTTFTKETHLEIDLPEADGQQKALSEQQIEVVVDAQGNFTVNERVLVNKQLDTLREAIARVSGGETDLPFIITGDSDANYQSIVSVMYVAGKMGFVNLSMTTRAPEVKAN